MSKQPAVPVQLNLALTARLRRFPGCGSTINLYKMLYFEGQDLLGDSTFWHATAKGRK